MSHQSKPSTLYLIHILSFQYLIKHVFSDSGSWLYRSTSSCWVPFTWGSSSVFLSGYKRKALSGSLLFFIFPYSSPHALTSHGLHCLCSQCSLPLSTVTTASQGEAGLLMVTEAETHKQDVSVGMQGRFPEASVFWPMRSVLQFPIDLLPKKRS